VLHPRHVPLPQVRCPIHPSAPCELFVCQNSSSVITTLSQLSIGNCAIALCLK
jgi:hypothetical protein